MKLGLFVLSLLFSLSGWAGPRVIGNPEKTDLVSMEFVRVANTFLEALNQTSLPEAAAVGKQADRLLVASSEVVEDDVTYYSDLDLIVIRVQAWKSQPNQTAKEVFVVHAIMHSMGYEDVLYRRSKDLVSRVRLIRPVVYESPIY